jgi:hypothetical protein
MCLSARDLHQPRPAAPDPAPAREGAALPPATTILHHPYTPLLAPASLIPLVPAGYLAAARRARERGDASTARTRAVGR